ncbi:MAG: hypothetical protein ACM3SY_20345 [Candidatus Omnitrophota bacterium]
MSMDTSCFNCSTIEEHLKSECEAMAKYALGNNLKVPPELIGSLQRYLKEGSAEQGDHTVEVENLVIIHDQLAKIIEPAKPRLVLYLNQEARKNNLLKFLGPVPFIRRMMGVALISLVLFILISLSPAIDANSNDWDPLTSSGFGLFMRELFLLSAASIGVSFISLFRSNRYIADGTFDAAFESSYWVRYILGIMAGFLLATLIPVENSIKSGFAKPLLALLGGFSTDVVYEILNRIVEAVKSMISGDMRAVIETQKQSLKTRMEGEQTQNRFLLASEIIKMKQQLAEAPEEVKQKLDQLANKMIDNVGLEKEETTKN